MVGTPVCNYLLWYCRNRDKVKVRKLFREKSPGEEGASVYQYVELQDGSRRRLGPDERADSSRLPRARQIFSTGGLDNNGVTTSGSYDSCSKAAVFEKVLTSIGRRRRMA